MYVIEKLVSIRNQPELIALVESKFPHIKFNLKMSKHLDVNACHRWKELKDTIPVSIVNSSGKIVAFYYDDKHSYRVIHSLGRIQNVFSHNPKTFGFHDGCPNFSAPSVELLIDEIDLIEFIDSANAGHYDNRQFPEIVTRYMYNKETYEFVVEEDELVVEGYFYPKDDKLCIIHTKVSPREGIVYSQEMIVENYLVPVILEIIETKPKKLNTFGTYIN